MLEKIEKELDAYYDLFDESFPLMQSDMNEDKIKSEIFECLKKNKKAQELWPDKYGSANGKII